MKKFSDALHEGGGARTRREVDSGTWPLYLYMQLALLASGFAQLASWEVPASVAKASPGWYDVAYILLQPIGALCTLSALLLVKRLAPSLQLERVGCIITAAIGLVYFAAVAYQNGGAPHAGATWLVGALAVYSLRRTQEISLAFDQDMLSLPRAIIQRFREGAPRL